MRCVENGRAMEDQEPARIEQETNQEGIPFVNARKGVEISTPGFRQARMFDDAFEIEAQPTTDETLEFFFFQSPPPKQFLLAQYVRLFAIEQMRTNTESSGVRLPACSGLKGGPDG